LIEQYFGSDLAYLRNLLTKDFAETAQIQLHFLKSFIVVKEKKIKDTFHDLVEQQSLQQLAEMFETFLTVLTRRLCEIEPEHVEYWVELDYFPTRKCMEVCR